MSKQIVIPFLSDAKAGDYFRGEYAPSGYDTKVPFEGVIWANAAGGLFVGATPIRFASGSPVPAVRAIEITRETPTLPTEHGTVFFATVRNVENVPVFTFHTGVVADECRYYSMSPSAASSSYISASEIDVDTVRIATLVVEA